MGERRHSVKWEGEIYTITLDTTREEALGVVEDLTACIRDPNGGQAQVSVGNGVDSTVTINFNVRTTEGEPPKIE